MAREIKSTPIAIPDQSSHNKWKKSPQRVVKCNIDAAFPWHMVSSRMGFCLRNDEGAFFSAGTCWLPFKVDVKEDEALRLLHALN